MDSFFGNARRAFNEFSRGSNSNSSNDEHMPLYTLARIFGARLKLIIYLSIVSFLFLVALIAQSHETAIPNTLVGKVSAPKNSTMVSRNRLRFGLDPQSYKNENNITTSIMDSEKMAAERAAAQAGLARQSTSNSFMYSIIFTLLSWTALLQIMRFCRRHIVVSSTFSSFSGTRRIGSSRQASQMMNQFIRMTNEMTGVSGGRAGARMAQRLRMALLQRDFTGDDFELLQQLDEDFDGGISSTRGADQTDIDRLPLHRVSANELRTIAAGDDNSNGGDIEEREVSSFNENVNRDRLQSLSGSSGSSCSVCLAPYESGDEVRTLLCLHKFHKACIDPWLRTNATCPICKCRAVQA